VDSTTFGIVGRGRAAREPARGDQADLLAVPRDRRGRGSSRSTWLLDRNYTLAAMDPRHAAAHGGGRRAGRLRATSKSECRATPCSRASRASSAATMVAAWRVPRSDRCATPSARSGRDRSSAPGHQRSTAFARMRRAASS
jgi:hypothetical protein